MRVLGKEWHKNNKRNKKEINLSILQKEDNEFNLTYKQPTMIIFYIFIFIFLKNN